MNINILQTPTISPHFLSPPSHHINPKSKPSIHTKPISKTTPKSSLSDPFVLQIAETFEDSLSTTTSTPPPLQKLRSLSTQSLLSLSWPTKKDEPFRFTDVSYIKSSNIQPVPDPTQQRLDLSSFLLDTHLQNLVFIDGYFQDSLSNLSGLPKGVVVSPLSKVSDGVVLNRVSEVSSGFNGDLFWSLNGVGTPDIVVVYVPEGCKVECPLYLRYFSIMGGEFGSNVLPVSNPRVLVVVEKGGELGLVEEFVGGDGDKCYWSNSVLEIVVGEGGCVTHSYVQTQSLGAAHIKWTCVRQDAASTYKLVELSSGGKLSRHNLHVQQVGPETITDLSTLHLSINDQTQDLHSSLILDHPRGYSRQLHKCIVAHSRGQAVFDGNVRVNRYAQQTDAGQLTRSLLLVPQATVNVKPNLQIIADDVKCSHGAAISDLEEDQLFYFLARGIDMEMARKALIFSFGAEVLERIPYTSIRDKAKTCIAELLQPSLAASRS